MGIETHLKNLSPRELQAGFVVREGYQGSGGFMPSHGDNYVFGCSFDGTSLGYAVLRVRFGQTVVWDHFYPLDHAPALVGKKTGIGTLAHVNILDHLQETAFVDDCATVVHSRTTNGRDIHLDKMGVGHGMPFSEYRARSRQYAVVRKGFTFD
jgi:hypothetical protein